MSDADGGGKPKSPNFQFLKKVDPLLVELGMRAERYALDDPNTSLIKARQMGELLAQVVASRFGIDTVVDSRPKDQRMLIDDLYRARALNYDIKDFFHSVRRAGNEANHSMSGDQGAAVTALKHIRKVAVWFYRTHINKQQKLGSFVPPLATATTEIVRLGPFVKGYMQREGRGLKSSGNDVPIQSLSDAAAKMRKHADDPEKAEIFGSCQMAENRIGQRCD